MSRCPGCTPSESCRASSWSCRASSCCVCVYVCVCVCLCMCALPRSAMHTHYPIRAGTAAACVRFL